MATHDQGTKHREQANSAAAESGETDASMTCPRCNRELEQYRKSSTVTSYRCPDEGCHPESLWWCFKQWLATRIPGATPYQN